MGPPLSTFDGLVAERSRIETQIEIVKHHLNQGSQAKARPARQLPRLLTRRVQAPLDQEYVANLGATLEALTKVRAVFCAALDEAWPSRAEDMTATQQGSKRQRDEATSLTSFIARPRLMATSSGGSHRPPNENCLR